MEKSEASALAEGPQESELRNERLMIKVINNVEHHAGNSVKFVRNWSIVFARDTEQGVMAFTLKLLESIAPALTNLMELVKSKKVLDMARVDEIHKRISKQLSWFNHNLGDRIPLWPVNDEWKHLTNENITEILKQAQDYLKISVELLNELIQEGNLYNESRKQQSPKRLHSHNNEGDSLSQKQTKRDQTDQKSLSRSSQFAGPSNVMPQNEEFQAADDHLFDDRNGNCTEHSSLRLPLLMANSEASALAEGPLESEPHREKLMIEIIENVENEARHSVVSVSTWSIVFARDMEKDAMANALELLESIASALTNLMEQVKSKKVLDMARVDEIQKRISKQLIWYKHNLGDRIPVWVVTDEYKHLSNDKITEIFKQVEDHLKISVELLNDLIQEGNLYNEMTQKQSQKRCHFNKNEGDYSPLKQAKRDQTDSSQQPSSSSSQFAGPSSAMPHI